ncbi:MAG: M20/M25/M40 family metallo-hydrolase [Acidobacteria bacterium]|nr:M20/M25/M40 family metallo-hydrolase [Acidobacteriota bacterium]MCA1619884.1 M20/M25/M40 family metallo-hydrolase [Acidobacteriota bacterium]
MINQERIKNLLLELVQIDSVSREERDVAERIKAYCEEMGAEVFIDDAGEKVGGNTGNVIARFPGTLPRAEPIMMSAHMDTVVPGRGVKPIVEGDIIRTDGTTILGGDDKSGCAVIIEAVRCLREQDIPHAPIDAVFSICEEVGLLGAKHLDLSKVRARYGLVFDSDDPGFLFTRGPSADHFEIKIYGLESHAGVAPEQGISAIRVAAEAIAAMKLFRVDEETTANIGAIQGGEATNIITNLVTLRGEARSLDDAKLAAQTAHIIKCCEDAARRYEVTVDGVTTKARVESHVTREYHAMDVSDDSRVVKLVKGAAARMGLEVKTLASGGGCDANIFNKRGIECANLGTGMRAIHTVKEWLDVKDMYASAEMTLEIMRLNGESAGQ